jgi:Uma2 family endonuclease
MPVLAEHRFNVKEYYRMAETGVFRPDARMELRNGRIIDISPIGPFHGGLVNCLIRLHTRLARDRWQVAAQNPVRLEDHSEPEPDFMLLKPSPDDYKGRHPRPEDVFLLVEVSDATLDYDREEKIPAYGRAGIAEVWIVDLHQARIEVYREPHFTGYGSRVILGPGDEVAPLAFPDAMVKVAELLRR